MRRYFFHVHDGRSLLDHEGTELPDLTTARCEAVRIAGRTIEDAAPHLGFLEDWHMEVTDERGLVLFHLDFRISAAPAISEAHGPR